MMRKKGVKVGLSAFLLLLLCAAVGTAVGCESGKQETLEIVSAEYVQHEENIEYLYVESEADQAVSYAAALQYKVAFQFKSSTGREVKGKAMLRLDRYADDFVFVAVEGMGDIPVGMEVSPIEADEIGESKELTITFWGNDKIIAGGQCELTVSYDVVHVVTACALNEANQALTTLKKEFVRGEAFDPSVIRLDVTYGDGTTETMDLAQAGRMKQLKGTGATGFDSSTCGFGKHLSVKLYYTNGSSTTTLYYTVTPPAEWTRETASGYGEYSFYYHKTADMTIGEEMRKGVKVLTVSFDNVKLYACQGNGYLSNPTASLIQNEMNKVLPGSQVNLFNLFVPGGNKAVVTELTKQTDSGIKASYNLTDEGGEVLSQNVLYDVYSTAGRRQIMVTVENVDRATEAEIERIEEFVSYLWFR